MFNQESYAKFSKSQVIGQCESKISEWTEYRMQFAQQYIEIRQKRNKLLNKVTFGLIKIKSKEELARNIRTEMPLSAAWYYADIYNTIDWYKSILNLARLSNGDEVYLSTTDSKIFKE